MDYSIIPKSYLINGNLDEYIEIQNMLRAINNYILHGHKIGETKIVYDFSRLGFSVISFEKLSLIVKDILEKQKYIVTIVDKCISIEW